MLIFYIGSPTNTNFKCKKLDRQCFLLAEPRHSWCPTPRSPGVLPPPLKPAWILGFCRRPLDLPFAQLFHSTEWTDLGPRRGQERPPGTRRPAVGLADLRRDTPCPAGTPTGAGATASPLRGFGHLLTVSASRNPAPSRDAAAGSAQDSNYCWQGAAMRRYVRAGGRGCCWGWFSRF